MKKITFLFILLAVSFGYSQVVLEDFEGTPPTVTQDNGLGSFNIIADPTGDGRGNVLEVVSSAAGDPWQQANLIFQDDNLDLSADTTVLVDIYSTTAINILSRTEDPGVVDRSTAEAQHNGSGWQTLVFDFSGNPDGGSVPGAGPYTQISFFPMWAGGGSGNSPDNANWFLSVDGNTFLVDTVSTPAPPAPTCSDGIQNQGETGIDCGGPCSACPPPPTDFTELIGNGDFETGDFTDWIFDPGEEPGKTITITTTNPSGGVNAANINNTVMSSALGLKSVGRGIGIVNPGDEVTIKFDARGSFGVGGVLFAELFSEFGGGNGATNEILSGGPLALNADPNVWTSFEFTTNLGSNVTGGISLLFLANPGASNEANVFIDNVSIINNDQVLSTNNLEKTDFRAYPNPTQDNWTIETSQGTRISSITVFDVLGKSVMSIEPKDDRVVIDGSELRTGLYFAKVETAEGTSSIKLVKK